MTTPKRHHFLPMTKKEVSTPTSKVKREAYYAHFRTSDYFRYPPPPYIGKGWCIMFEDRYSDKSPCGAMVGKDFFPDKAVMIYASSKQRAQYVVNMILASHCLLHGSIFLGAPNEIGPMVYEMFHDPLDEEKSQKFINAHYASAQDIPLACMIAAKASQHRNSLNALFKLCLSYQTFNTSHVDLDPSYWRPSKFVFNFSDHHVRCAYAIILAYSVIEELHLEIRATRENPSMINGKWNPKVRLELDKRLKNAHIDLSERFLWTQRDTPTRIERQRPVDSRSSEPWCNKKIRDCKINIQDAIAQISWLRSNVSSHRFEKYALSLNYIHVTNAQDLARRLLLECLGFWRYQPSEIPTTKGMKPSKIKFVY